MTVITRSEMLPLLVQACPAYAEDWKTFTTDYADDPEPFFYVALAQFSRCLSRALAEGDRTTMTRVFDLLERFIVEGDAQVQEAAIVGIVKNLQNASLHERTTPDDYLPFVRPETGRWWEKVKTFRANNRPIIED